MACEPNYNDSINNPTNFGLNGTGTFDPNAIHSNVSAEIFAISEKTGLDPNDLILIEDSGATLTKKKVKASNITAIDPTAIHSDVASEITAITEKTVLVGDDVILIEDSEAGNVKKKVKISNLPDTDSFVALDQTVSQTIINGQPIQDTLTASELVATDASKKLQSLDTATYPDLTELAYVKGVTSAIQSQINGKLDLDQTVSQTIINGQPIQDTLTASELVATDASKKLQSLDTATYPDLTELAYVKGVTSAIQSQINGITNPVDLFTTLETPTNRTWIDTKTIYRKVISCGALPDTTTKNTAHGLTGTYSIVHAYGHATTAGNTFIPIPFIRVGDVINQLSLSIDTTNVILTSGADLSSYTSSYVVLEYTKG